MLTFLKHTCMLFFFYSFANFILSMFLTGTEKKVVLATEVVEINFHICNFWHGYHRFTCLTSSNSNFIFPVFRYTTSPHLFSGDAEEAFIRVRDKVCSIFTGLSYMNLLVLLIQSIIVLLVQPFLHIIRPSFDCFNFNLVDYSSITQNGNSRNQNILSFAHFSLY